jgi:hypothetical protein
MARWLGEEAAAILFVGSALGCEEQYARRLESTLRALRVSLALEQANSTRCRFLRATTRWRTPFKPSSPGSCGEARPLRQSKEELNHAEGKLSNAGGAALRENVERLREALQNASDDEIEVEVETDAWRLLRDTLREVENEEGAHLGRAVAGPLTASSAS